MSRRSLYTSGLTSFYSLISAKLVALQEQFDEVKRQKEAQQSQQPAAAAAGSTSDCSEVLAQQRLAFLTKIQTSLGKKALQQMMTAGMDLNGFVDGGGNM